MKIFGLISLLMMILIPLIKSTDSDDFYNHLELEKAQIRNRDSQKVAPGQIIASIPATSTKEQRAQETGPSKVDEEKKIKTTQTASSDEKSKPKKEKPSDGSGKEKKKTAQDQDEDDDINKLPKRLFRPRFRAESSAESISISSTILTLAISAIMILFI